MAAALLLSVTVASPGQALVPRVDGSASVGRTAERIGPPQAPGILGGAESRLECSWTVEEVRSARPSGLSEQRGDVLTGAYIGFSEQPGRVRRATVMFIDSNVKAWCNDELAMSPEPTNTTGLAWDFDDRLMVVVEARTDIAGDLAVAAAGGWLRNFSDRNETSRPAKSLVIATIDVATGTPTAATFITAMQRRSFQAADLVLSRLGFEGGGYRIDTLSIEPPRRADRSTFACDDVFPYRATYVFPADFSRTVVAGAPGCG